MSSEWYSNPDVLLETLRRSEPPSARTTPVIPGYADLVELAAGGQGVVYTAYQESTKRRVAIKLLHTRSEDDPTARRRFEREIDLVARLRHPNIVRLYDSGSTDDGRLYCVMDFIEGEPLDEHLRSLAPALPASGQSASVGAPVLGLFRSIALALTHAHQRGVTHRDLKPSNIRVDREGTPHVLDFGLAKVIDADPGSGMTITEHSGRFAGSLPWASPEQVAGDSAEIDTRTDIYSLGVMLYHAVTGSFPYDVSGSVRDVLNTIAETEPAPIRAALPGAGRDLERVILTCLHKDKDRRYQNAADVAEDLRRVMTGEPILAQSDSSWYTMRRTLRRYRAIAAGAVAALVTLAVFAGVMGVLFSRATIAEKRATDEAQRAQTVNEFLERMLASPDPGMLGRDVTVRSLLAQASVDLNSDADLQPLARASLHEVIARTYLSLGDYEHAESHAASAAELSQQGLGTAHERTIESQNLLAGVMLAQSRFDEADTLLTALLKTAQSSLGDEHPVTLSVWSNFAQARSEQGAFDEAIKIHARVYETRARVLGPTARDTLTSLHNLAVEESWAGRLDESKAHYELAAELTTQAFGLEHPDTISTMSSLAVAIEKQGDAAGSEAMLREILPRAVRVWGEDHRETNILRSNLAFSLEKLGRHDEALELTRSVYESSLATLGEHHTDTINAMNGFASALYQRQRYDEAADLLTEAVRLSQETFGPLHFRSLDSGMNLAQVLRRTGRLDEAALAAGQALKNAREFYAGQPHADLAWFTKVLGDIHYEMGDFGAAIPLHEEARQLVTLGNDEPYEINILKSLGRSYLAVGRTSEAGATLTACLGKMRLAGADEDSTREIEDLLASIE